IIDVVTRACKRRTRWRRIDVVVAHVEVDFHLENSRQQANLLFSVPALFKSQRGIALKGFRSRHDVREGQTRGAESSGKHGDRFQVFECVPAEANLNYERQVVPVTAGECTDQSDKRSLSAPVVMRLNRCAVDTERDVSETRSMSQQCGKQFFKVPTVGDKARFHTCFTTYLQNFTELRMQRGLASGEIDYVDTGGEPGFVNNTAQKIDGQEASASVIQSIFVSQAITTMQITGIR